MNSIKFSLTKVAVATAAFLSGCGGGGGSSADQQVITGRVADGYINGAIVFWDCDGNYALGKNEVWVKSGSSGAYSISAAPAESCVLTANVPIGAIDEDNPGSPVSKSYTLLSVKGQESFISPLSTLVAAHVIGNPEAKISDAEKVVSNFLGVQGSIYSNYIESGGDDAIKMRGAAKIAAAVLQKNNSPSNSMNGIQNAYLEVKNIAPSLPAIDLGNSVELNKFIVGLNSGVGSFEAFNFKKSTDDAYDARPNKNLSLTEAQLNILDNFIKKANDRGAVRSGVVRFSEMTKNDLIDLLAELRKEKIIRSSDDPLVRNLIDIESQKLKNIDDYYKEKLDKLSGLSNFFGSDVATNIFFAVDVGIDMLGAAEGAIKLYTNVPVPDIDLRKFRKQPTIKFYRNIAKNGEIGSVIVNIAKSLSAANKFSPTLLKSVEAAAARSDESTFSAEEFTALMKLAGSIAELVEDSIKSKNAAPLFFLASSLNGILVEGHCSAKYEWVDCAADVLEILGLFVEKMNLGARLEGATSVMSSYLDAYIVGRDYAKETNKSVGIAILDVDTAWQDQINIIRKNSLINQIAVSGVENLFEAYNASEPCAANEFRSHGVCVSNQKNCGSLSAPVIPVQLAPPYVANPGLTYGFSTTPSPKVGYPYGSYLWKTSELSTPLIGASAQQNFVFNTVGSATVSVTPILTDGTVCTTSSMTTQVTVESALVRTVASVLPSSATIGTATPFTITGQNLPLTPAMTLGGIPCQIQSSPAPMASGFTAVCTPSGSAGSQVVKVSDASGVVIDQSKSVNVSVVPNITMGWTVSTYVQYQYMQLAGIAIDNDYNIYGTDISRNMVYKISSSKQIDTYFDLSSGYVNCAYMLNPYSVALGVNGYIYVADTGYNIIDVLGSKNSKINSYGYCRHGSGSSDVFKFNGPVGIAAGYDGSIYVANAGADNTIENNYIAKISANGSTSVLAGSNSPGFADGQGSAASFNFQGLSGMAVDRNGNIYVADSGNHRIRKISPSGYVTTVAGSGVAGFMDGQALSAAFKNPSAVAVDSKGNIYVADAGNLRVRMISVGGVVTTIAGGGNIVNNETVDGIGSAASFLAVFGMTVDKNDNVYVTDAWRKDGGWYWGKIRKISYGVVN